MASTDDLELTLTCAICLDVPNPDDAIETSCCHQLFCLSCITTVGTCPVCRKTDFQTVPAHFARRIIGGMIIQCPNDGCTEKVTRSNLTDHISNHCAYSLLGCPDPKCKDMKCFRKEFLVHLIKEHEDVLMKNYHKLWEIENIIAEKSNQSSDDKTNNRLFDDRLDKTLNKFGLHTRLGSTGKFYCGGQLDGGQCSCCNKRCGLSNGCNCSGCMLLDVQKRRLPYGWFVNRDGAATRCSEMEPTKFYCGRMVMKNNPTTDGYCGPDNGEQCEACRILNEQRHSRYAQIWS
ncbi:unnamed protein product [Adineta ricciae]|uniref:RING-type domain-containing protein n=1 Tax=Adineta ricciae TaxID=249248 RepID=A0A814Y4G6_ADIRI|nr:unnamed protein product [Adineta ricciae]CAF1224547.1 unnamed protein product [Adineta ricciae]